jgi:hypothetical protein
MTRELEKKSTERGFTVVSESKAEEIARLQREIAVRQNRLAELVLGDLRQNVSVSTNDVWEARSRASWPRP